MKKREASGKAPDQEQKPPKRRRVMNRACFFCRKDHKACDTKRPCERCINLNNAEACQLADRIIPPVQRTKKIPPPPPGAFNPFGADSSNPTRAVTSRAPNDTPVMRNSAETTSVPPRPPMMNPLFSTEGVVLIQQLCNEIQHLSQVTEELRSEQQALKQRFTGRPPQFDAATQYPYTRQEDRTFPSLPFSPRPPSPQLQYLPSATVTDSSYTLSRNAATEQFLQNINECWDVNSYQPFVIDDATKAFAVFKPFQISETEFKPVTDYRTNFGYLRIHRIAVNDSFCNFVQYSRSELLQTQPKLDLIIPKHRKHVNGISTFFFQRNKLSVSPIFNMTPKWRIRDGTIWPTVARGQMFYNEQGQTSFFIICIDALIERRIPRHLYLSGAPAGSSKPKIEEVGSPEEKSPPSSSPSSSHPVSPENNNSSSTVTESEEEQEEARNGQHQQCLAERGEKEENFLDFLFFPMTTPSSSPSSPYSDPLDVLEQAGVPSWK